MHIARLALTTAAAIAFATPALAHIGQHELAGFAAGFSHPLLGLDHVLAMLAVGVLAARQGGRAALALPAAFLGALLVGGIAAAAGAGLPLVELGIAGSVIVLGLAILFAERVAPAVAAGLVAVFGVVHGHAHGSEIGAGMAFASYAAGFLTATALLHAAGLALAAAADRRLPALGLARASGIAFALAGAALLAA